VAIDSRSAGPGDLFVALKGERNDGHDFVRDVAAKGAAGALVSREIPGLPTDFACLRVADTLEALQRIGRAHRQKFPARVTGITGSNGKTTTKEMLSQILSHAGKSVLSTLGNLNSQIGLPLMLMELQPGHTHMVLEMGASEKGNIARLCELAGPQAGIITNIGKAHLEFFGGVEGVLNAKWELVESLPKDGLAVLCADDPLLESRRKQAACSVTTFGISPQADVRAENVRQTPETVFDLICGKARQEVRLPVPGLFNVMNALAAAAVAKADNISMASIAEALADFRPPQQRMQVRRAKDGVLFVIDAYNANPSSMKASLESFDRAFPDRRKVAVLGGMRELGPYAEPEHRGLGEFLAALGLERIYFLGPEGEWVRSGLSSKKQGATLALFQDKEALRAELRKVISGHTAVLFKASRGVRLEDVYEPLLREDLS
jgi:UDP-N-acetylmuramoyl-tripeptide--D-alanyl-D-alanine ligase